MQVIASKSFQIDNIYSNNSCFFPLTRLFKNKLLSLYLLESAILLDASNDIKTVLQIAVDRSM